MASNLFQLRILNNINVNLQTGYPVLFSSAALCLIISITAALLRESDCCCSRLKCSLRSLEYIKNSTSLISVTTQMIYIYMQHKWTYYTQYRIPSRLHKPKRWKRKWCRHYLQRGTWHWDSLQARACSWRRYHIFLQRTQPPDARVLHCIPCRKSPFTFRQFGYWQSEERHWDACTKRSSIFLSCNIKLTKVRHTEWNKKCMMQDLMGKKKRKVIFQRSRWLPKSRLEEWWVSTAC